MARRKRASNFYVSHTPRSPSTIAKRSLEVGPKITRALDMLERLRREAIRQLDFRPVQDRRRYHPAGRLAAALSVTGNRTALVAPKARANQVTQLSPDYVPKGVQFKDADRVLVCVRRNRRREVLFAAGAAGGKRVSRRRRRNQFSDVIC